MIRLSQVSKRYVDGDVREVLSNADLEIQDGEFIAITGRSGSGKTTLLNIIGGLDTDFTGEVEVFGKRLDKLNDNELSAYRNQSVGFVFQSFHLLDHFSCLQNVMLPAALSGQTEGAEERALELLAQFGLKDRASDLPRRLSGGQKQRVAIARALFHSPPLLLCDEPTGNLDSKTGESVMGLFQELQRENGITLLVVTHDPKVAASAMRRVEIVDGTAVEQTGQGGQQS